MKPSVAVIIFITFNVISHVTGVDYCSLCNKHIACNNPGILTESCPDDAEILRFSQDDIDVALKEHNTFRNELAGGNVVGSNGINFETASDMSKVSWDPELARHAALNVMQCDMKHDGCRATKEFPHAGQNLYYTANSARFADTQAAIKAAVKAWSDESVQASQSTMSKCCSRCEKCGHFLQLAQGSVTRIGCAASKYTKKMKTTLVACNYSYGNMVDDPVYTPGLVASSCKNGRDSVYENLCL